MSVLLSQFPRYILKVFMKDKTYVGAMVHPQRFITDAQPSHEHLSFYLNSFYT